MIRRASMLTDFVMGLYVAQTTRSDASVVGATTANVLECRKIKGRRTRLRPRLTDSIAGLAQARPVIGSSRASILLTAHSRTGLPNSRTGLVAICGTTGRRDARPPRCSANTVSAGSTLTNMTALPAIVRISRGVRTSCRSRRSARHGTACTYDRIRRGTTAVSRQGCLRLNADVRGANQAASANAVCLTTAIDGTSRAPRVVVITATTTVRHRAATNQHQQHCQSLVQSHRFDPFPSERLTAFHALTTKASFAYDVSMTDCPCDEITDFSTGSKRGYVETNATGRQLVSNHPGVFSDFGLGLYVAQTTRSDASVVGATAADVIENRKIERSGTCFRSNSSNRTVIFARLLSHPTSRSTFVLCTSKGGTRLTNRGTRLIAVCESTSRVNAGPPRCSANTVSAGSTLANMTALPAIVRISRGVRTGCRSRRSARHGTRLYLQRYSSRYCRH